GDSLGLTSSKDVLEAVAIGEGPQRMLVTLGYAGWGPGQLEDELEEEAWVDVPAEIDDCFAEDPERLWRVAIRRHGGELAVFALEPDDPSLN
ncbi:MAG: YqgE/AlgH family protein, partial [Actinomycetota bacterium]